MEWSKQNKYSSFNSMKGLAYYEQYKGILAWLKKEGELPPPIECNLDPFAWCNLNCHFCIGQRYLVHHRDEIGNMTSLPLDYMLRLVDFLVEWGVRGLCISGGGEPTLHKELPELLEYANGCIDLAVVTNATNPIEELQHCRWVALSVDSASRETYKRVKGIDRFYHVCRNIEYLTNRRKETDFCFKFLILPENQNEIYDACKLAKELGVQDFHARPVDFERKDIANAQKPKFDMDAVQEQFAQCHAIETDDFRVYTIMHKFDKDFHVKYDYQSCLAAPLILPILTDGNAYLCVEHKMEGKYKLGSAFPDPENILKWWGNEAHHKMIKSVLPQRDCSRCIYCEYHHQMKAIEKDSMCFNFP